MPIETLVVDPSTISPQMAFNNGQVANNAAVMDPDLPNIPGPESPWKIIEWSHASYLQPSQMVTGDSTHPDPNYGMPVYGWQSGDGTTVRIYQSSDATPSNPDYIFNLDEPCGGIDGYGANLFLSTNIVSSHVVTFDHPIDYSLDAKITSATLIPGGHAFLLAQVFTGFIVAFNASGNPNYDPSLPTVSAFIQLGIANSSGSQYRYLKDDGHSITYTYTLPNDKLLPYQVSNGEPTHLSYNVNHYLDDLIANDPSLPAQAHNLANWNLGAMYIGLETDNIAHDLPNPAKIDVGLQISHVQVQTDTSTTATFEDPASFEAPLVVPIAPKTLFDFCDSSTGGSHVQITSNRYDGPLSFLHHQDAYSYGGNDSVTITASGAKDPLLATGRGNDILTGSATGTSVLDGGTGANIEIDNGNGNTTFVANGYSPGNTWDFIKNFHAGDRVIIFGYIPKMSELKVSAVGGAGIYQGATVMELPGNGNSEAITFVGTPASSIVGCSANIEGVPSFVLWSR